MNRSLRQLQLIHLRRPLTHYENSDIVGDGVFPDGLCRNERVLNDSKKSQLLGSTRPRLCEVSQDNGSEVLQKAWAVYDLPMLRKKHQIKT